MRNKSWMLRKKYMQILEQEEIFPLYSSANLYTLSWSSQLSFEFKLKAVRCNTITRVEMGWTELKPKLKLGGFMGNHNKITIINIMVSKQKCLIPPPPLLSSLQMAFNNNISAFKLHSCALKNGAIQKKCWNKQFTSLQFPNKIGFLCQNPPHLIPSLQNNFASQPDRTITNTLLFQVYFLLNFFKSN